MEPVTPTTGTSRPTWQLVAIALPLGVLLNGLLGGWDHLANALMVLLDWAQEPTALQRWTVKMLAHLLAPALAVLLLLKATRVGEWLAPNRLAMGALLAADCLLLLYAARGLYMAGTGGMPFLTGLYSDVFGAILTTCVAVGLVSLAAATLWHRLVRNKPLVISKLRGLLQEV